MSTRVPAPLVGLYSPAPQSGKSTLANAMAGFGWQTVKFAGGLKAMTRALLEYQGLEPVEVDAYLDGPLKERPTPVLAGRTPRHAMQTLGTEWGRERMARDFWVDILVNKAAVLRMAGTPVIVDDMRFPNEAAAILVAGGVLVRVTRPGLPPRDTQHASEGGLDDWTDWDLEVTNDAPGPLEFALDWAPRVSAFAYERAAASGMS